MHSPKKKLRWPVRRLVSTVLPVLLTLLGLQYTHHPVRFARQVSVVQPSLQHDSPIRLVVSRGPMRGGLCNQLYNVVAGLVFAASLGADFILPTMLFHSQQSAAFDDKRWFPVHPSSIYDVEGSQEAWLRATGLHVHGDHAQVAVGRKIHVSTPHFQGVDAWLNHSTPILHDLRSAARGSQPVSVELLTDPGWFLGSHNVLFLTALRSLAFSSKLKRVAAALVGQLASKGLGYNCLHLRVEADFIQHPHLATDPEHKANCSSVTTCLEKSYKPALSTVDRSVPLYVASGIFEGEPAVSAMAMDWLHALGFAAVHNRMMHIPTAAPELRQEEMAAVNMLVCAHADVFIGTPVSSYAAFISQYRLAHKLGGQTIFVRSKDVHGSAWFYE